MKTALPYAQAHSIATKLIDRFAPNCTRIELAGSLRRRKSTVGDLELIAIPTDALYAQLDDLLATGKIRHREPRRAWGQKLRSFLMDTSGVTVQVDLFLQPDPATLGINYMIRTGSSEFSHRMVTRRSQGGWMPDVYQVNEARVWCDGVALDTPEEADVFRLWGMEFVEPEFRTGDYVPVFVAQPPKPPQVFGPSQFIDRTADWPLPAFAPGAARAAIEESERLRRAGLLKPIRPTAQDEHIWEEQ